MERFIKRSYTGLQRFKDQEPSGTLYCIYDTMHGRRTYLLADERFVDLLMSELNAGDYSCNPLWTTRQVHDEFGMQVSDAAESPDLSKFDV